MNTALHDFQNRVLNNSQWPCQQALQTSQFMNKHQRKKRTKDPQYQLVETIYYGEAHTE